MHKKYYVDVGKAMLHGKPIRHVFIVEVVDMGWSIMSPSYREVNIVRPLFIYSLLPIADYSISKEIVVNAKNLYTTVNLNVKKKVIRNLI